MINAKILSMLGTDRDQLVAYLDHDVREVFSTMMGLELESPCDADPGDFESDYLTALVGFAGSYNGMVSVCAPKSLALAFAGAMLGMECQDLNEDVSDALGEIANMVGGSFKHHFVDDGHEVRLSTPSVISGIKYEAGEADIPNTLTTRFLFNQVEFSVSVFLQNE